MNFRMIASTFALSLTLASTAAFAAAVNNADAPTSRTAKVKMVTVHVRNTTSAAIMLKDGDQQFTIQAGKEGSLKLPTGSQLMLASATTTHQAGDVLGTVDSNLSGNTLIVE